MKKSIVIAAALLLASPGLSPVMAQSMGEKTGVNSVLGVSPSTQDFVTQAAISDMFEIESSRMAVEKASDAETKAFANQMITAHTKTSSELKGLISSQKVSATVPAQMDDSHRSMLDKLRSLDPAAFTKQYRSDQEKAHENAVSLFKRYADGGENAALKDWAGKTLPELQHHLDMAKKLAD